MKILCLMLLGTCFSHVAAAQETKPFEVKQDDRGVDVFCHGELLTRYEIKSGAKPVLFPLFGPDRVRLTRNYPMSKTVEFEKEDHIHHRSFWFTHGDVNGVSFWHEQGKHGTIEHQKFEKVVGGKTATIVTTNDWLGPDKTKMCSDRRTLTFGIKDGLQWIDFDITIRAGDKPVTFGDTKEGCFGIRVAGSMKVDAKQGGRIINSEGQSDKGAWGKPAAWVDYHGKIGKKVYGVSILNHPSSYGYPTHWHVRTYGLFAANPFGMKHFHGKNSGKDGKLEIKPNNSINLRYRVLLHRGDEKEAKVAEHFSGYQKIQK